MSSFTIGQLSSESGGGGGGGEANTASNVGTGSDVFKQKVGVDLEMRTIIGGTNTDVIQNADDLTINSLGQVIYDGEDTQANILAMPPAPLIGEVWWASDTKVAFQSVFSPISGLNVWQSITLIYDATTDTFELGPTQDGQVQNLGREIFFVAINSDTAATELNPKVFMSLGAVVGNEDFKNVFKVKANDIPEGALFGLNTTDAMGSSETKIITYGNINGVDTSAWATDAVLYVDPVTPGDLTSVQPTAFARAVAKVSKSDATEGILFVNTITNLRIDEALIPVGFDRFYFTGETEITGAGTFYKILINDRGAVASATEAVIVPDNSTVGVSQDHLGAIATADATFNGGLYGGQIQNMIDVAGGQERLSIEVYYADADGNVIDSGIVSEPVGDLGVRPIIVMTSALLDNDAGDIFFDTVEGVLAEDFTLLTGNRSRLHIVCEKVGVAGPDKTFTLYYGSDASTYADAPARIQISDVQGLPEELDDRVKWLFPWVAGEYVERTMTRVDEYTMMSNTTTSDFPAPTPVGDPAFLMDAAVFGTLANTSVVYSGHKYIFSEAGYLSQLRVWIPTISGSTNYRFVIANVTDPVNPIVEVIEEPVLTAGEWNIIAANRIIVVPGDEYIIYIDALNSGSSSQVTGGWQYNGSSNSNPPADMGWNRNNPNSTVRIDKTDLDTVDRSAELNGIIAGSELQFVETATPSNYATYITTADPVDLGLYVEYAVILDDSGGTIANGVNTTLTADVPVPASTDYSADAAFWTGNDPDFADVQGFLEFDGVDQGGNADTGFGVDIRFQKLSVSPDWDIVAVSGLSGGGGGSGESNTASNVGTGSDVFKQKTGVDLEMRTLIGGTNITLTENADDITIDAAGGGGGEANTASNVGTGVDVFKQKTGVDLEMRTLVAGLGVDLTQNTDDVTVEATSTRYWQFGRYINASPANGAQIPPASNFDAFDNSITINAFMNVPDNVRLVRVTFDADQNATTSMTLNIRINGALTVIGTLTGVQHSFVTNILLNANDEILFQLSNISGAGTWKAGSITCEVEDQT